MKYFPFFRGKQNEMIAVRDLASKITSNGRIIPIIEPVNANATTLKTFKCFVEESMPFLLICNPIHGDFSNDPNLLVNTPIIKDILQNRDNWVAALYVKEATTLQEFNAFIKAYDLYNQALVYYGRPKKPVLSRIKKIPINHHVFISNRVEESYIQSIPQNNRVIIKDPFRRQAKNADYPENAEFFTDSNTIDGNPTYMDFGDFSIVGDHYTEAGGPAYSVALHHIHFAKNSHSLYISHFISDRREFQGDTPGKTLEALDHLVNALHNLDPNNTHACKEYRSIWRSKQTRGLGYMKRLAIKHHLEVMLSDRGLP